MFGVIPSSASSKRRTFSRAKCLGSWGEWITNSGFIDEVVRSGGVCERDQVMNLYQTTPDLERYPGKPPSSRSTAQGDECTAEAGKADEWASATKR